MGHHLEIWHENLLQNLYLPVIREHLNISETVYRMSLKPRAAGELGYLVNYRKI